MEKFIEEFSTTTGLMDVLIMYARAIKKAIRLELDLKVARAHVLLGTDPDSKGKKQTQYTRWAAVDLATDELAEEAKTARAKATILYILAVSLKKGNASSDIDPSDMDGPSGIIS